MDEETLPVCGCRKAIYASKRLAATVRNERLNGVFLGRDRGAIRSRMGRPVGLKIYECPDGAGWHLATQHTRRNKREH